MGFRRPVGGRQHCYPCLDDQELDRDPERGYPIGANGERVLSGRVMDEVGLFWLTKTVDGRHCGCIDLLLVVDNRRSKLVVVEIEIDPGKRDKPENLQQFDLLWTEDRGVETACLALILPDRIAHNRLGERGVLGRRKRTGMNIACLDWRGWLCMCGLCCLICVCVCLEQNNATLHHL